MKTTFLLVLLGFSAVSALAQNATQVPAGTTAALGQLNQSKANGPDTPQGKMLSNALSSDTRKTLQEAMDSAPASK